MLFNLASWCVLIALGASPDASLVMGTPTVESTRYTIPVLLSGGEDTVSALDFHFRYDPALFEPVSASAGAVATQANKVLSANIASPGEYIVVLMGLNQESLGAGEIAYIELEQIGNPVNNQVELQITQPTLATHEGVELPVKGSTLSVSFSEEESDTESEEPEQEREEADEESESTENETVTESLLTESSPTKKNVNRNAAVAFRGSKRVQYADKASY